MKVWITKYALTQGILEADTERISEEGYCHAFWADKKGMNAIHFFTKKILKKIKNPPLLKLRKCARKRYLL